MPFCWLLIPTYWNVGNSCSGKEKLLPKRESGYRRQWQESGEKKKKFGGRGGGGKGGRGKGGEVSILFFFLFLFLPSFLFRCVLCMYVFMYVCE